MARGISETDVFKACDALLLEGARPTIERVRQTLGRGSPNTISPMLETWFKHLGARIKDPGAFSAPAGLVEPVFQAAQHLWEVAQAEARRDVDDRVKAGLASAIANVEAEKERAAIADASAFSANARAAQLQIQLDEALAALEAERIQQATLSARARAAEERVLGLQGEIVAAHEAGKQERSRADRAIAQAADRADAAERRAALEIDRERTLRIKAEKATEAVAKRFETALKAELSATSQLNAAEGRMAQLQLDAGRRESELQSAGMRLEARVQELETALSVAQQALARASAPEALADQILARLGAATQQGPRLSELTGRTRKKKSNA